MSGNDSFKKLGEKNVFGWHGFCFAGETENESTDTIVIDAHKGIQL